MSLVPLPASDFTVHYLTATRTLTITAKGLIPGVVLDVFLQRDAAWVGGLKFSFLGHWGGLGTPPPKEITSVLEEKINLPQPHFNSKSVIIETASGTYTVPIEYNYGDITGLKELSISDTTAEAVEPNKSVSSVLPPINVYLTGTGLLAVTARIPTEVPLYRISTSFNEEFLRISNVTVSDGAVNYAFKWEKFPEGEGNPQLLDVITEGFNGVIGPTGRQFRTVQGYIVHGVLLGK